MQSDAAWSPVSLENVPEHPDIALKQSNDASLSTRAFCTLRTRAGLITTLLTIIAFGTQQVSGTVRRAGAIVARVTRSIRSGQVELSAVHSYTNRAAVTDQKDMKRWQDSMTSYPLYRESIRWSSGVQTRQ